MIFFKPGLPEKHQHNCHKALNIWYRKKQIFTNSLYLYYKFEKNYKIILQKKLSVFSFNNSGNTGNNSTIGA